MKAVIQRVKKASVSVDGTVVNFIHKGLLIYVGLGISDNEKVSEIAARKIIEMRLYPDGDKEGVHSIKDIGGEILLISQFTLYADIKKGRRPSFSNAMPAPVAKEQYEKMIEIFNHFGVLTKGGIFQASMEIDSINDGPYTILLDSDL